MGDNIQIHLSKPGGHREGPYTLEQINHDLAARKYLDTDYWAWHEGLTEWVPLYALPGVVANGTPAAPAPAPPKPGEVISPPKPAATSPAAPPKPAAISPAAPLAAVSPAPSAAAPAPAAVTIPAKPQEPTQAAPAPAISPAPAAAAPEPEAEPAATPPQVSSGMPSAALEHIFVFTSGDGPSVWQSPALARMLEQIIGEAVGSLSQNVPRDVVARCAAGELLKPDGSISDAVWRAMAVHQPALVQQARERLYRVCVRTFRIEANTVVAAVLFYNKQKM